MKSFDLRPLNLRKLLIAIAAWYFILYSGNGNVQVGPFDTEAACNSFRMTPGVVDFSINTSTCFSTTAKQ